jgi:hypothetical protein
VVHVSDLQAVEAGGNAEVAAVPVTLVFDLDVQLTSLSTIFLLVQFNRIDLPPAAALMGLTGDQLRQQLEPIIQQAAPSQSIPFDMGHAVLGKTAQLENAAVAVDSSLSRVAVRAEAGTSSYYLVQRWESFINGAVDDHLQGANWSMYIDHWILEQMVSNSISEGLAKPSRFQLVSGVGSTYENRSGTAHVTSRFGGNVDAEICHPWFDVTVDTDITAPSSNTLGMDINLSWHENPWDEAECDVEAALIASAIGTVVGLAIPGIGLFVNGLSGFVAGLAGAQYLQSTMGPGSLPIPNCSQLSATHYVCTKKLGLGNIPGFGSLGFDSVRAEATGISLVGSILAIPLTSPVLNATAKPFTFDSPTVSCGEFSGNEMGDFLTHPERYVTATGMIDLGNSGSAPLFLCRTPRVLDDPLGIFDPSRLQVVGDQAPMELIWHVPLPPDAYYADPYPCRALVETTGGVTVVELPPVPPFTQEDLSRLAGQLAQRIAECQKLVDEWFAFFRRYNPHWSIDPGDERQVEHWWEVDVNGLAPGSEVTAVDAEGNSVALGRATSGESTRVSLVTEPRPEGGELGLDRNEGASAAEGVARGIGVLQTEFVRMASIDLPETPERLAAGYVYESPALLLISRGALDVYDLSEPTRPRLSARLPVPGLRGVMAWPSGAVGWGEQGLLRFTIGGGRFDVDAVADDPAAVSDAVAWQGAIYAATTRGIEVWSPELRLLAVTELPGARAVAPVGRLFVASDPHGIASFSASGTEAPVQVARSTRDDAGELLRVPGRAGRALFVASAKSGAAGGGAIVRFNEQGEPTEIGGYERAPWFAGLVQMGGLIARLVEGGGRIAVSRLGRTAKR